MPRKTPSNRDDIIDSHAVIERIEELESEREAYAQDDASEPATWEEYAPADAHELKALQALAEEASGYASDWEYGEALIRDSYFRTYAEELAYDTGAIDSNAEWPKNCIDWEEAASQLQQDYTSVDFDGVTYWIRR